MQYFRKKVLITVCWVLSACALTADIRMEYSVDVWQNDDGLPQSSVISMDQSKNGYLWFGTFNGLVRFDGSRFSQLDPWDARRVGRDAILNFRLDGKGRLWYAEAQQGLWLLENGVQSQIPVEGIHLHTDSRGSIREDHRGNLWAAGTGGLFKWDGTGFQPYPIVLPDGGSVQGRFVKMTIEGDRIWVVADVYIGELREGVFEPLIDIRAFNLDKVDQIEVDQGRGLWLNGHTGLYSGLYHCAFPKGPNPVSLRKIVDVGGILCILADKPGSAWVGSNGLGLYHVEEDPIEGFQFFERDLHGEIVRSLFKDAEGNIWVGTDGAGLYRYKRRVFEMIDVVNIKDRLLIYSLAQNTEGDILVGTYNRGIYRHEEGMLKPIETHPNNDFIWALDSDGLGGVWVGTYGAGLYYFNGIDCSKMDLRESRSPNDILALKQDKQGALWIGSDEGLFVWDGDRLERFDLPVPANEEIAVNSIVEDQEGALWIGTLHHGLFMKSDSGVQRFGLDNGLPNASVYCLYVDSHEALWVGTKGGGLARIRDGVVESFQGAPGLNVKVICAITEDFKGDFWIGSYEGIHRIPRLDIENYSSGKTREIFPYSYDRNDGLRTRECSGGTQSNVLRASDGKIWFATVSGLAVVDPGRMPDNSNPPPVVIESIWMDGVSIWSNPNPFLTRNTESSEIEIPPGNHSVEFHFTALNFSSPSKVRFRYRLEGLQDHWSDLGDKREVVYSNVQPGHYRFLVVAANNDRIWNHTGDRINITFLPSFRQTKTFQAFAAGSLLFGLFGFYRMRIQYLKRRHAEQSRFSRSLIESQEEERKRIAAELHDSLGQNLLLMKNWMDLGIKKLLAAGTESSDIRTASKLMTQSIQELRNIAYNLRPYQLDRLGLTKAIQSIGRSFSNAGSFEVEFNLDAIDRILDSEAEIQLYRIVQEACNNAHKHAKPNRVRISCRLHKEKPMLILEIEDDGRGFDPDSAARGKDKPGSFGLLGMEERVRILNGRLEIRSSADRGTLISIQIPISKSNNPF